MNAYNIAPSIRHNIQTFCDKTTMHGFLELYYSKSFIWKSIWLCVLLTAFGLSWYQVKETIKNAIEQPTTTYIDKFDGNVEYPTFFLCCPIWILCVDWKKSLLNGFNKESVVYGIAYLTKIHVDEPYNFTRAKAKFNTAMKQNNFTSVLQFFKAITFDKPPGYVNLTDSITKWDIYIHKVNLDAVLCYIATSELLHQSATVINRVNAGLQFHLQYNWTSFVELVNDTTYISMNEYYLNTFESFNFFGMQLNSPSDINYVNPLIYFGDSFGNPLFLPEETMKLYMTMKVELYKWMNRKEKPCSTSEQSPDCRMKCWVKEYMQQYPNSCLGLERLILFGHEDNNYTVCKHPIVTSLNKTFIEPYIIPHMSYIPNSNSDTNTACLRDSCLASCEQWVYSSTISRVDAPRNVKFASYEQHIYLQYPSPDSVFAIIEIESETWETIVSNIGGIIGLWLGASVMSVLQMVYLLFCSKCDESMFERRKKPKKSSNQQIKKF